MRIGDNAASGDAPEGAFRRLSAVNIWLLAAAVGLASTLLYAPTLTFRFLNWDDNLYVYANPNLGTFDWRFVKWAFTTTYLMHWSPLLWISLGIDHILWGFHPAGYHLSNILLHGMNVFLVVLLFHALLGYTRPEGRNNRWLAAAAGLLFGVHPLHVEAVAWVAARKDVLYSFCYLVSLLAYARYVVSTGQRTLWMYSLSLLAFLLSLMSKPMAVSLPAVLFVLDFYPFRRIRSGAALILTGFVEKLPFYLASFALSLVTLTSWKHTYVNQDDRLLHGLLHPLASRVWAAMYAILYYPWKALLPAGLSPYHPMPVGLQTTNVTYPVALAGFILITGVVLLLITRIPGLAVAWACYLIMIFPTLGIIRVFGITTVADRFSYLALLALILPVACGAWKLLERSGGWWKAGLASFYILALLTLAGVSVKQAGFWRDSVAFWSRNVEQYPDDYYSREALGEAYNLESAFDKAAVCFTRAIAMYSYSPSAYYGLSFALDGLGRTEEALRSLDKAVAFQMAVDAMQRTPKGRSNLAGYIKARFHVLRRLGRHQAAAEDFFRYAELSGRIPRTLVLEGRRNMSEGRPEETVRLFTQFLATASP